MAYLIDETYFTRELRIPNLTTNNLDVAGDGNFDQWIDRESRLCLRAALGVALFNDLNSNIDANGNLLSTAPQKWQDLVNGKNYTYQGEDFRWEGLIYSDGAFKVSLLAYYTYAKWLEFERSRMSGLGEVRGLAANTESVNSTSRYVSIWNTFVYLYQHNFQFYSGYHRQVQPRITYLRGTPFIDYAGSDFTTYSSLLEYLVHQGNDFPDADLRLFNYKNTLI